MVSFFCSVVMEMATAMQHQPLRAYIGFMQHSRLFSSSTSRYIGYLHQLQANCSKRRHFQSSIMQQSIIAPPTGENMPSTMQISNIEVKGQETAHYVGASEVPDAYAVLTCCLLLT